MIYHNLFIYQLKNAGNEVGLVIYNHQHRKKIALIFILGISSNSLKILYQIYYSFKLLQRLYILMEYILLLYNYCFTYMHKIY
jgi:hypothetical protein